ncbi:MAG: hypothetical protein K6E10_01005 [Eubacterium sp.]|nr:hypothetical protein [Eubacterium sp.]
MKKKIIIIFNFLEIAFTIIGTIIMMNNAESATGLTASGLQNLKFFTVLSNEFCGIVAFLFLTKVFTKIRKESNNNINLKNGSGDSILKDSDIKNNMTESGEKAPYLFLKYLSATAVGLTFLIIAAFLGPLYGHANLYQGSNLYFHLILPLVAMVEFVFLDSGQDGIRFKTTFLTIIPTFLYGIVYLINILINGVGVWPDTNDWYGFVNWGLPVGIAIFSMILFMTWLIALILRFLNKIITRVISK